jgi:hypothetical protein
MSSPDDPFAFKNILSGIIVTVVGGVILAFIIRDAIFSAANPAPTQAPTETVEVTSPTDTQPAPTETLTTPTPESKVQFNDFALCPRACKQNQDVRTFPDGTKRIYAQWRFANIPEGAHYVRSWVLEDVGTWMKNDCIWPGPATGEQEVVVSEPKGFHAGSWEMTITVDDQVVLRELFVVQGANQAWDPPGIVNACDEG